MLPPAEAEHLVGDEPGGVGMTERILIATQPIAVTRAVAAEMLGMGLTSFEVQVQPEIRLIRRGKLRLVPVAELESWAKRNAERTLPGGNVRDG